MNSAEGGDYSAWVGRSVDVTSQLDPWPAEALAASLGVAPATDTLPCLWHWLYFLETASIDEIGPDGQARGGRLLPPIPSAPRLFAGCRTFVAHPLRIACEATMSAEVVSVVEEGREPDPMHLVTVRHTYSQDDVNCIIEEQDFVFRDGDRGPPPSPPEAADSARWSWEVTPDPAMLMRFSALTFNSHRIHYDERYAREVEGYPERVVPGRLTAMLLAETVRRHTREPMCGFNFRVRRPLFVDERIRLEAQPGAAGTQLRALAPDGAVAATASGEFGADAGLTA